MYIKKRTGKMAFHIYLQFCAIEEHHDAPQLAAGFTHHPSLGTAQGKEGRLCNFILCPLGMKPIDYEREAQPRTNTRHKEPLCVRSFEWVFEENERKDLKKILFRHIFGRCNFLLNHIPS